MSNTRMRRISSEMDDYLKQLSQELTRDMGRNINVTDASRILAAHKPKILVLTKRRREIRVGGSLMSL